MGLGVTEEPIYLYLCGGVCVRHVCVRACVYYSSLRPICVVSAEQISQVISEAECYLYLSLSSLSFSPLSYIPIVSHPLSDLIFQLFSSLIPPVLAPSSFPISLSSLNLSAFRQSLSFPSFLTPSISRYFSFFFVHFCFCLTQFKNRLHSSRLCLHILSTSNLHTLYFSNFSEWEPSNLEAAHLSVDR